MTIPVVLASTSPSRLRLLVRSGIHPIVRPSFVDEPAVIQRFAEHTGTLADTIPAKTRVLVLSLSKAFAVAQEMQADEAAIQSASGERIVMGRRDESGEAHRIGGGSLQKFLCQTPGLAGLKHGPLVVGCDSMFEFNGHVYGKPHNASIARERLLAMRGKRGTLWTGHTVIDLATGRREHLASNAEVVFGNYSKQDIDRYIATKEPLEVAGSFTLEGIGGAFIDSVVGDPHGVIGLSLSTLRSLVSRLGYEWTDLWNTTDSSAYRANGNGEFVHQPGDGWIECSYSHRHWGLNGAAGVLLARRDEATGEVTDVLLQHRAEWSAEGGTWGIPGGAIADGENPLEGSLRESFEEANITAQNIDIVGTHVEDHGNWAYTTVFAFEKPGRVVTARANDGESLSVEWIPFHDVGKYRLLSYFGQNWPGFAERLSWLSARM
ncbi:MAG: Maf family protein [Aeriscardovia sp.]|nr:Maf family protein [Aeriscardovia sp.]